MAGQAQQTVIARRLAAWAAILAVPTAIAGIYGMNFEYMPELKWAHGYYLVIGVIVAICTNSLCAIPPQRLALVTSCAGSKVVKIGGGIFAVLAYPQRSSCTRTIRRDRTS